MSKLLRILSCAFVLTLVGSVQAQTLPTKSVSGSITGHKTWVADTVYMITSNVTVGASDTLTISAGTIVKFVPSHDWWGAPV